MNKNREQISNLETRFDQGITPGSHELSALNHELASVVCLLNFVPNDMCHLPTHDLSWKTENLNPCCQSSRSEPMRCCDALVSDMDEVLVQ